MPHARYDYEISVPLGIVSSEDHREKVIHGEVLMGDQLQVLVIDFLTGLISEARVKMERNGEKLVISVEGILLTTDSSEMAGGKRGKVAANEWWVCGECYGFQVMHIPMVSPKIPKGKWIKWAPPPFGILKLNTDGSSRNDMAAGGGIIRDYKGSKLSSSSFNCRLIPQHAQEPRAVQSLDSRRELAYKKKIGRSNKKNVQRSLRS